MDITDHLVKNEAIDSINTADGMVGFKIKTSKDYSYTNIASGYMLQRHQLYELSYSVDTKLVGETPQLLTVNAKTSAQGALVHNDAITIVFDSPNIFNSGTTPSVQLASPVDGDCTGLTSTATSSTEDYTVTVVVTL